jgi:hypothetical protein
MSEPQQLTRMDQASRALDIAAAQAIQFATQVFEGDIDPEDPKFKAKMKIAASVITSWARDRQSRQVEVASAFHMAEVLSGPNGFAVGQAFASLLPGGSAVRPVNPPASYDPRLQASVVDDLRSGKPVPRI